MVHMVKKILLFVIAFYGFNALLHYLQIANVFNFPLSIALTFFMAGCIIHNYDTFDIDTTKSMCIVLLCYIANFIMFILDNRLSDGLNEFWLGNDSVFVIVSSYLIYHIFKKYEEMLKCKMLNTRVYNVIKHISKISYSCYLLHALVLSYLYYWFAKGDYYNSEYPIAFCIGVFFLCSFSTVSICSLMYRIPIVKKLFIKGI